jgi:hypothetical protein
MMPRQIPTPESKCRPPKLAFGVQINKQTQIDCKGEKMKLAMLEYEGRITAAYQYQLKVSGPQKTSDVSKIDKSTNL